MITKLADSSGNCYDSYFSELEFSLKSPDRMHDWHTYLFNNNQCINVTYSADSLGDVALMPEIALVGIRRKAFSNDILASKRSSPK